VLSWGGNVCCTGDAITAGAFDQRRTEARADVLVYSSEPFARDAELSGPIVPTLYVSSDARDTDFTVKVLDVEPDGRAWNLDESIQRMRWRDGYDRPPVFMQPGQVYKVAFQPLATSNNFKAGHRLRIEVSSSNFPRFDRNLNTGGNNYDEAVGKVARNLVHHSKRYPSSLTVTVVERVETEELALLPVRERVEPPRHEDGSRRRPAAPSPRPPAAPDQRQAPQGDCPGCAPAH
jgi:uncharacterized protein